MTRNRRFQVATPRYFQGFFGWDTDSSDVMTGVAILWGNEVSKVLVRRHDAAALLMKTEQAGIAKPHSSSRPSLGCSRAYLACIYG